MFVGAAAHSCGGEGSRNNGFEDHGQVGAPL